MRVRASRGHLHDYRSVIARGVAQRLEQDTDEFIHAHEKLLEHNLRDPSQVHYDRHEVH